MKITVTTTVPKPLADVWQWYAVEHVLNHPRWDPEMELEQMTEGPIGVGTRIRRRNRHFDDPVDGEMEIIEWEPERAMGVAIHDANLDTHGHVTLEAIGPNRTRLTIASDFPNMDEATAERIRPRWIEPPAPSVNSLSPITRVHPSVLGNHPLSRPAERAERAAPRRERQTLSNSKRMAGPPPPRRATIA
jgi:hypothetical protein